MVDLEQAQLLPPNWVGDLKHTIAIEGKERTLSGASSTALEQSNSKYVLVDGTSIARGLPWLVDLYKGVLLEIANHSTKRTMCIDTTIASAININYMVGGRHGYELHVDSNPLTGLLFASSLSEQDGGALTFQFNDTEFRFFPQAGLLLLFDGRDKPHTVESIRPGVERISIPMNFYVEGEQRVRPSDLDRYLYD